MPSELKWYAVYTKPRWEKKVAALLDEKQVINYCPLNKVLRQWRDRKKIVMEPLFKSYVFVYVSNKQTVPVLQTDGVLNYVRWLGKPAVIREEEIELIKNFLQDHENVKVEVSDLRPDDRVRISTGPLMLQEGNVVNIKGKTVKVYLPSLGIALYAEVEKSNLEKIY